jgi:hypothetical protein
MSDDVELAVVPAPVEEVTTAPESDAVAVEVSEESQAAKTFSQEELDAAEVSLKLYYRISTNPRYALCAI